MPSPAAHARTTKTRGPPRGRAGEPRLAKAPSGIQGLDEITGGGLPRGRPTLVCGGPGCGKTLFAMEFLVRGATRYGEPGVFMAFEETAQELAANVASLGFDLTELEARKKLAIDYVRVERSEIEETGEYDSRGALRPASARDRDRGRQARGARHHRVALLRLAQPHGAALRAAPTLPLAQGAGHDRGAHRREG